MGVTKAPAHTGWGLSSNCGEVGLQEEGLAPVLLRCMASRGSREPAVLCGPEGGLPSQGSHRGYRNIQKEDREALAGRLRLVAAGCGILAGPGNLGRLVACFWCGGSYERLAHHPRGDGSPQMFPGRPCHHGHGTKAKEGSCQAGAKLQSGPSLPPPPGSTPKQAGAWVAPVC